MMEYTSSNHNEETRQFLVTFAQKLWENCPSECLKGDKEIFRLIPFIANIPGMPKILKDFKEAKTATGESFMKEAMSA